MRTDPIEVEYFVLPNLANPCLLARVRWPDVFEAISPTRADWQQDPGLFDLPHDPARAQISSERAAEIAREWGATLGPDDDSPPSSLLRRMPANWSDPSRAEQRAWSVEFAGSRTRRSGRRGRFSRRRSAAPTIASEPVVGEEIIDLTEASGDTMLPAKGP